MDRRELKRSGEPIPLEPQVFDLLVYLVQNRDRVVSKDDLIASVWEGRIVSDSTLTSRINAVRRAVGDSGEQQKVIRTMVRKGIRFVGQVVEQEDLSGPPMREGSIERRLTAILAADVADYSRLMSYDEVATLRALKAHRRELVDPNIARHHGRIVKTTGDGMLVEFASAVDACRVRPRP